MYVRHSLIIPHQPKLMGVYRNHSVGLLHHAWYLVLRASFYTFIYIVKWHFKHTSTTQCVGVRDSFSSRINKTWQNYVPLNLGLKKDHNSIGTWDIVAWTSYALWKKLKWRNSNEPYRISTTQSVDVQNNFFVLGRVMSPLTLILVITVWEL